MSAIASEMDGGWTEIVWRKERCSMRAVFFCFVFFHSLWGSFIKCVQESESRTLIQAGLNQ